MTPERQISETMLGSAMRALARSAKFHTTASWVMAPKNAQMMNTPL